MTTFSTLGEAIAAHRSSTRAVNFIDSDSVERRQPYADLHDRAAGLLQHFQRCSARPGSEMLLVVDRNEQFIDAFWAGILGNLITVPIAPGANDEHRAKFFRILERMHDPHLCTDSAILARLTAYAVANGLSDALKALETRTVLLDRIDDISTPGVIAKARPDDIAFVQYSSGSTSEPKGVALTHRNLLANIAAIAEGIGLGGTDIGLSWMPLTHDMGLIGFHLTPLVCDIEHHLMPTTLFVRRPALWLSKASAHRASILCSPNFGYRHYLNAFKPEYAAALDLKPVRILFNGAEPISATLCREFAQTLGPCGLDSAALFPVYGLAEASLAVTFPAPGRGCITLSVPRTALARGTRVTPVAESDPQAATFVAVGRPVRDCRVRIADETGTELPDDTVGHILIAGANVTAGYYRDPAATQAVLRDGWLDTGDLGFMSAEGLVVTGRAKEIIFVSGQNYYPQDIEAALESDAGIGLGRVAVGGSRVANSAADEVLVFVIHRGDERDFLPVAANVRRTIAEKIGIPADHVIPVLRLPKTTSGKIQRFKLVADYQHGEFAQSIAALQALAHQSTDSGTGAHGEIERTLKAICDELLNNKAIGLHDNIFELGTSSLTLAQIYERVEAVYPGQLEVTDFFDYPTIAELAKYLESRLNTAQP